MNRFSSDIAEIVCPAKWGIVVVALLSALSLSASSVSSYGQQASAGGTSPVVSVPDFNGVWGRRLFGYGTPYIDDNGFVIDGYQNPFLRPWSTELVNLKASNLFQGDALRIAIPHTTCWPEGVPGVLGLRQVQIMQSPTEIIFIYDADHHNARQIYLNQQHSASLIPSWMGESVGHFEGDTLVVDTIGFVRRPEASVDRYGTPVTEGLHVVERYRLVDETVQEPPIGGIGQERGGIGLPPVDINGKTLRVDFIVEDHNVYRKPWAGLVAYKPDPSTLRERVCAEGNRSFADLMPVAIRPDF